MVPSLNSAGISSVGGWRPPEQVHSYGSHKACTQISCKLLPPCLTSNMSVLFSGNGHPLLCRPYNFCLYFMYYWNFVPSLAVDTWISSEFDWRYEQCLLLEAFFSLPVSWENVLNQLYTDVCYITMILLETSSTKIMKKLEHLIWDMMMIVLWRIMEHADVFFLVLWKWS